jgi:hypothetical protein
MLLKIGESGPQASDSVSKYSIYRYDPCGTTQTFKKQKSHVRERPLRRESGSSCEVGLSRKRRRAKGRFESTREVSPNNPLTTALENNRHSASTRAGQLHQVALSALPIPCTTWSSAKFQQQASQLNFQYLLNYLGYY